MVFVVRRWMKMDWLVGTVLARFFFYSDEFRASSLEERSSEPLSLLSVDVFGFIWSPPFNTTSWLSPNLADLLAAESWPSISFLLLVNNDWLF